MKKKINIRELLDKYLNDVADDLKVRWNLWVQNLGESEQYEVIGGLMARQISITKEFANNPNLWNPNIAPILMRSLIDNYINFTWILLEPEKRSQQFIFFGLGQEKLQLEHRKKMQEISYTEENGMMIKAMEDWINSQQYEFLTVVNIGSWSEKSVREMALETNEMELYNFCYQPFSSAAHNMWNHISNFNLFYSENPLHKFTKVPVVHEYEMDIFWMELAIKYTHKLFVKFDEKFPLKIDRAYASDLYYEELTKTC